MAYPPRDMTEHPLVARARELAQRAHAGQLRKSRERIPYFVHLERVANTLAAHGHDDVVEVAAGYLHDLLEDQPAHEAALRNEMPREVVEVVELLTEQKLDASGRKRPKAERFKDYLEGLRAGTPAARRALAVSCADKIDNARSLAETERRGENLLGTLNTRPGEHAAQLWALRELYADVVHPALLEAFDDAAHGLMRTIDAWLPGRAVAIAANAHLGQLDKAGAPYVYHPLRLMLRARSPEERMAAVLHDVVEDSEWTLESLAREGFSPKVLAAIDRLTRRPGESYDAFIDRVAHDPLATRVKLLDLEDNSDLGRLPEPTDEDRERVAKYRAAQEKLRHALSLRNLYVRLADVSVRAVRALAVHTERKGEHVTLAHRVEPARFEPAWVPGGHGIGEQVRLRAVGMAVSDRVQALVVEMAGTRERPIDRGTLHVTVSRHRSARSRDSNELLAKGAIAPLELELEGEVAWDEPA